MADAAREVEAAGGAVWWERLAVASGALVPAVLAQVLQSGPEAIGLFGRLKTYCYGASPISPGMAALTIRFPPRPGVAGCQVSAAAAPRRRARRGGPGGRWR